MASHITRCTAMRSSVLASAGDTADHARRASPCKDKAVCRAINNKVTALQTEKCFTGLTSLLLYSHSDPRVERVLIAYCNV